MWSVNRAALFSQISEIGNIQLFEELRPVLSNKLSIFLPVDGAPELFFQMSHRKRQTIKSFDWEMDLRAFIDLYTLTK